jgi:hypothetical protein
MSQFHLNNLSIELPADATEEAQSRHPDAWTNGSWLTVRITCAFHGLRAHTDGKPFAGRAPSSLEGSWILIDDVIQTSTQIVTGRALPGLFSRVAEAILLPGCVMNIGQCSPLFGFPGGGWQAEYVERPTYPVL